MHSITSDYSLDNTEYKYEYMGMATAAKTIYMSVM